MTATLEARPAEAGTTGPGNGGGPARRAVVRWAWRLFRREWRQQVLVLALLTVAVGSTTAGLAVATNGSHAPKTTFNLPATDPLLAADLAVLQQRYGPGDAFAHQRVPIPGSVSTLDLRAGVSGQAAPVSTVRLLTGKYPDAPDEMALTRDMARILGVGVGGTWSESGRNLRVVGLVEDPRDLGDQFALLAPGSIERPQSFTFVVSRALALGRLRLPSGGPLGVEGESPGAKTAAAIAVLALATMGLLFVGLVAVAGFTVMAQRRLRALGMLGSLGATDRNVRLVMLANGAAVGAASAVVGAVAGLTGWFLLAPRLESVAGHRIDRLNLQWWAIGMAMVLAFVTAVAAAWWPARAAARLPVVTALSGRPPTPQPVHRFAALGGALLAGGLVALGAGHPDRPVLTVAGTVTTTIGVLLLAPLAIRVLAVAGRRMPIAVRLALRDLARYQARAGAALGALTLAVGIATTIAVSAAAAETPSQGASNLPANQLVVHVSADPFSDAPPQLTTDQLGALRRAVDQMAAALGTHDVLALEVALYPTATGLPHPTEVASLVSVVTQSGRRISISQVAVPFVATPEVLSHYGIRPVQVDSSADILTWRKDLSDLQLSYGRDQLVRPRIQVVDLPRYTAAPTTLITTHAVAALGLTTETGAWLVQAPHAITATQAGAARRIAAGAGLAIETRQSPGSARRLRDGATAAGILLALGVLAMTVGLIRSETANDLRTLAATGAGSGTRRTLTSATAAALALLGGLLGAAGAYAALLAWHHSDLHTLGHPPVANLIVITLGLPLAAAAGGWLLAGREPQGMARRPID